MSITGWARTVLERPGLFATLGTVSADGAPHPAVVWYFLRGDSIVVNSAVGRHWPSNLERDPRFSFVIEDGYEWLSLRGNAETLQDPDQAQEDIARMARHYHADDPAKAGRIIRDTFQRQQRISFLLHPSAIYEHPDD